MTETVALPLQLCTIRLMEAPPQMPGQQHRHSAEGFCLHRIATDIA
jgi:hypothetical protein